MAQGIQNRKKFFNVMAFMPVDILCVFFQLPQQNPAYNQTPFKFTKYSNAYMLVYIRDTDKDKVICNVDEKDIAQHLQVHFSLLLKVRPVLSFPGFLHRYFMDERLVIL